MFARAVVVIGVALAAWMSAGRWLFGLGGWLTWWYVPTLGLVYVLLHLWIAHRITATRRAGHRTRRGTRVTLGASWASAVAFGVTVPDVHDGELTTIISHGAGPDALGMAVALCNPLGIMALAFAGAAVAFASIDARGPRPAAEDFDGPVEMRPHPLS